ncbi:MAG: hypothetical protein LBK82_14410 [Planctomycetaceae bacterium]|nr:hypothetical protein [Planctomycetaceae bacterium]
MTLHFAVVNLVHSRLSPTQPFSERLPTSQQIVVGRLPYALLEVGDPSLKGRVGVSRQ